MLNTVEPSINDPSSKGQSLFRNVPKVDRNNTFGNLQEEDNFSTMDTMVGLLLGGSTVYCTPFSFGVQTETFVRAGFLQSQSSTAYFFIGIILFTQAGTDSLLQRN